MKVIWVKHPIYNIEVSNTGLIKGVSGTIRKPRFDKYGYLRINFWHDKKMYTKYVHRLVCDTFIECGSKLTVDHVDGNKTNNHINNLQLMTAEQNYKKYFEGTERFSIVVDGVKYKSKREYERITGNSRHKL